MKLKKFMAAAWVAALFISCSSAKPLAKNKSLVMYQYPNDKEMWNHVFSLSQEFVVPEKMPAGIIIPHHDICSRQQNSFYKALSKLGQPSVIVILSPNHFEMGDNLISVPKDTVFDTPNGILEIDSKLENKLLKDKRLKGSISLEKDAWHLDHGIFIHTPFIKHYFPETKILPLLLKGFSNEEEFSAYEKLGRALAELLPPDALVVASVDFSHYQIPLLTELHDHVTMNSIQNKESLMHVEVDSPESLTAITTYCNRRGATEPVLINRSCTYDFIPDEFVNSTSHQYWTFYSKEDSQIVEEYKKQVEKTKQRFSLADYKHTKNQTILIGGSGKIEAGVRKHWSWDRYSQSQDQAEILLHDFAGTEARFLTGWDALIFDPLPGQMYASQKHGTELFVNSISLEKLKEGLSQGQASFGMEKYLDAAPKKLQVSETQDSFFEVNFSRPRICVLVVSSENAADSLELNDKQLTKIFEWYDIVLCRSNVENRPQSAWAYLKGESEKEKTQKIELGVLLDRGGNAISGKVLFVDWYNGKRSVQWFDYQSDKGIPPAIHQGEM